MLETNVAGRRFRGGPVVIKRLLFRSKPPAPTPAPPAPAVEQIPVFGFMRFSTLIAGKSGFRQMHDLDLDARAALLFAPERMEMRFRFFEALALPSLIAQDRDDWEFIVLYASQLPDPYRSRLLDLLAPHPNIHAVPTEPDDWLPGKVRRQMNRRAAPEVERWVSFRLDDDDALSDNFVSRLRIAIGTIDHGQIAITFPRGHVLGVETTAGTLHLDEDVKRFGIGCGLAVHAPRDMRRGVYSLGAVHRHVDNAMPTISDARAAAYVIGAHIHSDTGSDSRRVQSVMENAPMSPEEIASRLGPEFAHLDLDRLLR